jgi:hypothetical protein
MTRELTVADLVARPADAVALANDRLALSAGAPGPVCSMLTFEELLADPALAVRAANDARL